MFARFFAEDPLKTMYEELGKDSPDQHIWRHVSAYLARGRRPKDQKAQEIIRAYLDLRDSLGPLAIFRNNAELSHKALAEPCRDFFCKYNGYSTMEHPHIMTWARFCLAADHLLAVAYEARLEKGQARRRRIDDMKKFLARIRREYLTPLQREGQKRPQEMAGAESREREDAGAATFSAAKAA